MMRSHGKQQARSANALQGELAQRDGGQGQEGRPDAALGDGPDLDDCVGAVLSDLQVLKGFELRKLTRKVTDREGREITVRRLSGRGAVELVRDDLRPGEKVFKRVGGAPSG
jgi:hypothetical protein